MFNIEKRIANANIGRTIRFTENLFEELDRLARENGISFNALVLQCCLYALEHLPSPDESGKQ